MSDSTSKFDQQDAIQHTELLRDWDRWVTTMSRIEKKRNARISQRRYRRLHRRIVKRCQTKIGHPVLCEEILRIVAPWVTLDSVSHADRRIIRELLKECDQLNHSLRSLGCRIGKRMMQLTPLFVLLSLLYAVAWKFDRLSTSTYMAIAITKRRVSDALSALNTEYTLALITLLVVGGGVWITRDTRNF